MKVLKERTDWMDYTVTFLIFFIPSAILIASIAASFTHIKDWALLHVKAGTPQWQGWAFACIVELIPIFGVLLLWKLRKAELDLTIPRVILGAGFLASMAGQIAYAGGFSKGGSRLIVAAAPSIVGLIFTEICLWLFRAISEKSTSVSQSKAATFVPPPPTLIIPDAPVSPPAPEPVSQRHVAPADWVSPPAEVAPNSDTSAVVTADTEADVAVTQALGRSDNPQATALIPPPHVPPTEDADNRVSPAGLGDDSLSTPGGTSRGDEARNGGTTNSDTGDDDAAGSDIDIDPRALEARAMRQAGKTRPEVAAHFNTTTRTIDRWTRKAEAARPINGNTPELTGASAPS